MPSVFSGVTPDRCTLSAYGRDSFAPNQMICRGFSTVFTNAARPGSICTLLGRISYDSWSPLSLPLNEAVSLVLPRLSTASFGRPRKRPFTVGGTSSARTSVNGVTVTFPSGTVVASGCSVGVIRTPYGWGPAVASGVRGGANVSSTDPVVPGYSRSVCGSTTVQGAREPTASKRYSSTTSPVLRSRSRTVVLPPGSTVAEAGSREVQRLTPGR